MARGVASGAVAALSYLGSVLPANSAGVSREEVLAGAVDALAPPAAAEQGERAASEPGAVTRGDVKRIYRHVRENLKDSLVDLQAGTLEADFIRDAEVLVRDASLRQQGQSAFRAAVRQLAERYGLNGFPGSVADTWYRTVVLNGSYNSALHRAYNSEPTRRLYPFITIRTAGDSVVRDGHAALDGFVAATDWPGWRDYLAPLGWNCRCRAIGVPYATANALGWIGQDFPRGTAFLLPRVGKDGAIIVPGRDPGFSAPIIAMQGLFAAAA